METTHFRLEEWFEQTGAIDLAKKWASIPDNIFLYITCGLVLIGVISRIYRKQGAVHSHFDTHPDSPDQPSILLPFRLKLL